MAMKLNGEDRDTIRRTNRVSEAVYFYLQGTLLQHQGAQRHQHQGTKVSQILMCILVELRLKFPFLEREINLNSHPSTS
jgi:hypothetical protein